MNTGTGLVNTSIRVDCDYVGEDDNGNVIGSLADRTWHLLIAKTIDGIDFDIKLENIFPSLS